MSNVKIKMSIVKNFQNLNVKLLVKCLGVSLSDIIESERLVALPLGSPICRVFTQI